MEVAVKNASHLFEYYKKSESWWTTLFSMLLLHLAATREGPTELSVWKYRMK